MDKQLVLHKSTNLFLEEINILYDKLIKKYNQTIHTHLRFYKKIYKLQHSPIVSLVKNEEDYVYLSERLIKFFFNTDYYFDEKMELKKLIGKINYILHEDCFMEIKNTDEKIYNELSRIVGKNYISKKILIYRFIRKYTNTHKIIHIVI